MWQLALPLATTETITCDSVFTEILSVFIALRRISMKRTGSDPLFVDSASELTGMVIRAIHPIDYSAKQQCPERLLIVEDG